MNEAYKLIDDLADAILDGAPIDWPSTESAALDADRPLIGELKVLAALAAFHRRVPEFWGHLRLLDRIGGGSFGEVYRAWDPRLDREVALKLLPASRTPSDRVASSIIDEGRMLARVRHPGVVTIHGAEEIDGQIGLWMEFVRGETLEQFLERRGALTAAETIDIGLEVCGAVAAVHRADLLHRDIKAQNVMRADDGRIMLMDFGTGRDLNGGGISDLAGTPLYLAPEVLQGHAATVRSDIYSLGVLLYRLSTGAYPVHARTVSEVRHAHELGERSSVRTARRQVPARLARTIERALDPQPERRYPTADDFRAQLAALKPATRIARVARFTAAAAALVVLVAIVWEASGRALGLSTTPSTLLRGAGRLSAATIPATTQPAIVVLPFQNQSGEADKDDLVDGLTDEIVRNLTGIRGLQVRSRASSFAFKTGPRNVRDIGGRLNAAYVLDGSVRRSGTSLRINAQLFQVAGEASLWAGQFDRPVTSSRDVSQILDEISRAIVNQLRLTLDRGQRRYDLALDTYELYLRGQALLARRSVPAFEVATHLFEQVLDKDPTFAPAYAGLASAQAFLSLRSLSFEQTLARMRTAAAKAIELDPLLAEAHAAMGWVHAYDLAWDSAESSFKRAIQLNTRSTQTYTDYAIAVLEPVGKLDEALRILTVALQNDPLSLDVQREIGQVQLIAGRYDDALATFRRVEAVDADFPIVNNFIARSLMYAGRLSEAIPLLEKMDSNNVAVPGRARRNPWLAQAYVRTGRRADAETLAHEHRGHDFRVAIIYAALGEQDQAFAALDRAVRVERHRVPRALIHPEMAALHGDPRWMALRKQLNLPAP